MKRTLLFWLLLILLGIGNELRAQTASITQGCEPLTVSFTAPAGSSTYFWDFDDGATANQQNPDNTFTDPGTYTVEFSESAGGPVVGTITIDVYPQPVPEFTASPVDGCSPLNVSFDDITQVGAGVIIQGYTWVFGDGGIASGASPNHVFTEAGNHFVSLEIQTNLPSCNTTELYNDVIFVINSPSTSFSTTPAPASACDPPLEVSFNNNSSSSSPLTYHWNFGNGNSSTEEDPASQTYTTDGSFTVILTATDTFGCTGTFQQTVNIGGPTTSFAIPDTVCLGDSILMDNQSTPGFYTWQFAPGNIPVASGLSEPWVHFLTPGIQDVTLTTSNAGCSSDTTIQIFVEDPSAAFTSDPSAFCHEPTNVQFVPLNPGYAVYEWMFFHDSTESSLVSPIYTVQNYDTTEYSWYGNDSLITRLIVESSAGCRDTMWHVDTLWMPNAAFFPDVAEGCAPLEVMFYDSSTAMNDIISWEWHLGDGQIITEASSNPQTVTYTNPGHYDSYLIIQTIDGCIDTSYNVTTIVGDQLNPSFTVDLTTVCPGDPIQFTNTTVGSDSVDVWHYYSETNRQFHCFDDPNPTWSFTTETGLQDVVMMVGWNGCYSTTLVEDLIQVDGPIAEIFFNCECDQPFVIEFENRSHDYTDIVWDFGDTNTSTAEDPTHTYAATGDYTVTLTATNSTTGCPISVDSAKVFIRDIQAQFVSDSVICSGVGSPFDASLSQDVHAECWGGYTWQFDNPAMRPITTTNPTHPIEFPASGTYGVTLIVKDINDCKDTISSDVGIYDLQTNFQVSDNLICSPTEVVFTDLTTSDTTVASWNWDFGDMTSSVDQNPTHIYSGFQDTLWLEMIAIDAVGCTDTSEWFLTMYDPISHINTSPFNPNLCVGETAGFFATDYTAGGSNLNWDWDFGDGGTASEQNPTHQFDSAGTFFVEMIYTEIASGCIDSTSTSVNVQAYPIADFVSDGDSLPVFCNPQNVVFTNTSEAAGALSSWWDMGNGNNSSTNPAGTVYTSGTYTVTLITTTTYGCADTVARDFIVVGPEGSFMIDKDTICRGEEITFTLTDTNEVFNFLWDFGDGNSAENIDPVSHTYTFVPPSGQTFGKLIVTGLGGECPAEMTIPIYIHEVIADFQRNDGIDTALCFQPYPFENLSLNSDVFYWNFGDGNESFGEEPGLYEYAAPGTYEVILGVRNEILGCTDTIIKDIILHPIPEIAALGDTICEGDVGDLLVIDIDSTATYTWVSTVPVAGPNDPETTSQPFFTEDYIVNVVDTNSCINSDSTTIFVINQLDLMDWDTTIVIGDSICLPMDATEGLYIFEWTPTTAMDCDTCSSPCVQPLELITYSVEVTDILGCFTSEADFRVDIHPETFIAMPTTFTPNGDGANDYFYVEGWGIKELLEYRVFNRWGEELFLTTNQEEGWDGHYKGVLQNNDVYVYKVRALTWRDEVKSLEGYFNLLR